MDALPPPPPPIEINVECLASAAAYYNLPPELVLAIRMHEAGTVGRASKNTNGSKDLGPMQINTIHMKMFSEAGVPPDYIMHDECTNLFAGSYILYREFQMAGGDTWRAIGNYHSRTPVHHERYKGLIYKKLKRLMDHHGAFLKHLREKATQKRVAYLAAGRTEN